MKRNTKILITTVSILLIVIYTLASTYSVIINITDEDGVTEIVNEIRIRDLLTNDDGSFNNTYYQVKNELSITDDEAELLMNSTPLNDALQIVLNSIVDYKYHNDTSAKLTNDELYNMIVNATNETANLSEELKTKVINKSLQYKQDISDFVYDIEVSVIGEA